MVMVPPPDEAPDSDSSGDIPPLSSGVEIEDLSDDSEYIDESAVSCDEDEELFCILPTKEVKIEKSLNTLLKVVRQLIRDHEWQKALPFIQQIIAQDPDESSGWLYLGIVYLYTGKPTEAAENLNRATNYEDTQKSALYFLALNDYRRGRYLQAQDYLKNLISLDSGRPGHGFSLGCVLFVYNYTLLQFMNLKRFSMYIRIMSGHLFLSVIPIYTRKGRIMLLGTWIISWN